MHMLTLLLILYTIIQRYCVICINSFAIFDLFVCHKTVQGHMQGVVAKMAWVLLQIS